MISSEIKNSIINYLNGNATEQEIKLLENWIVVNNHKELFKEYVQIHHAANSISTQNNYQDFINKETVRITKTKKRNTLIYLSFKYAAILILFLTSGYFLYQTNITKNTLMANVDQITLQLANGEIEVLNENSSREILDIHGHKIGTQQANRIVYHTTAAKKPVYNQLSVPYGKQFELVLSDGTCITVNSGTTIEYPTQLATNQKRKVKLKGEAYFNVAKDSAHPFVVTANNLKVRVLGTQFNISAYPEEQNIATVLVEGLVGLYDQEQYHPKTATLLTPGFKGIYNEQSRNISKQKVDTRIYTGWKTGLLIFRNIPFQNILKRLERTYNIQITNNNKELNLEYFNASFDTHEDDIYKILNTFKKSYNFTYTTKNNQITIH
ncbi:hypothetical protein FHR24_002007 [Wenyingzhuangia heitensis]|uniref:FecR family protein n=1 Tax=Wenyingzhuangia heitensis TaxID=1487859 RepID=A0ABX0U9N8_9FLAO|nr:FecR family protein [Wenyingzhuangia heitensis]NIJ45539.1 hypothetical protein [Wenyingzhuangia heitensis]